MKFLFTIKTLRLVALPLFCALLLMPNTGLAQIKALKKKRTTRAVVIGIADYQNASISLQFTDDDASAFADYLSSKAGGSVPKDHIKLLTNEQATQGKVAMALTWLMEESNSGDLAIIYFSGHGDVETTTMMNFGYLLTYDAPTSTYMAGGAFPINFLEAIVQTMATQKAVDVLLIADACHSGKLAGSAVKGTQATAQALATQFGNAAKILSCQPEEFSQESTIWGGGHSVFSYFLIDGLIGLADKNKDNKVSMLEIQSFLQENVPPAVAPKSQIPSISGKITMPGFDVDPPSLAALIESRNTQANTASATVAVVENGKTPGIKPKDTLTMAQYQQFQLAIKQKHLLHPAEHSAYALYHLIKDKAILAKEAPQMRSDLVAALQDEAQQAINNYLAADTRELQRRWTYDTAFQYYPEYLAKAAELVGQQHFSYTDLTTKKIYFEGLNLRMKAEQEQNDALYDQAIQKQHSVLSLAPNAAFAYNELGLIARRKKEYEKSLGYFEEAIKLAPTWALAQNNTCASYIDMDSLDLALKHCQLAINSDANFANAYHNLGIAYDLKEQYQDAISAYSKALSLDPHYPTTYFRIGITYYELGLKDLAVDNWQKCINEAPTGPFSPRSWNNMAEVALEKKDLNTAMQRFDKALEINPDYKSALLGKSLLLAQMGRDENALESLELLLKKGYKDKAAILNAVEFETLKGGAAFQALIKQYFKE